jgi:hypothetical protein
MRRIESRQRLARRHRNFHATAAKVLTPFGQLRCGANARMLRTARMS